MYGKLWKLILDGNYILQCPLKIMEKIPLLKFFLMKAQDIYTACQNTKLACDKRKICCAYWPSTLLVYLQFFIT